MPLPRSMSSLTLCCAWEKWETILLNPGKQIEWYSDNDYFSELNRFDGQLVEFDRVEDFLRIHYSGNPQ